MRDRDVHDRRYRERLAGSYFVSFALHALAAALLFAIITNTSQEGASENVTGGEVVTLEQRAPSVPRVAESSEPHVPLARAPRRAPPLPAPRPVAPPPPPRHELANVVPSGSPNPPPAPPVIVVTPRPPQPSPEPFTPAPAQPPAAALIAPSAAPIVVPTAVAVAVTIRTPAPTQAPTAPPTVAPAPSVPPTALPTPQKPASVATPRPLPSARPTPLATAKPTALPSALPTPAIALGVPSPHPSATPQPEKTPGVAPTPGSIGVHSPAPNPGAARAAQSAAPAPVAVNPTPTPSPVPSPSPKPKANDFNAKLRSLLPNTPVTPTSKSYHAEISLNGRLEPTPPPDVLARTKYLFESGGGDERYKMWVSEIRKRGGVTLCVGWMIRYPEPLRVGGISGGQITIGGGHVSSGSLAPGDAGLAPIVEADASVTCKESALMPFAPSPPSSP